MAYKHNKNWRHSGSSRVYQIRRAEKRRYRSRTGSHKYRRPWTLLEDQLVLAREFDGWLLTDRELALEINRSVQAIQVRRCRLKNELKNEWDRHRFFAKGGDA